MSSTDIIVDIAVCVAILAIAAFVVVAAVILAEGNSDSE